MYDEPMPAYNHAPSPIDSLAQSLEEQRKVATHQIAELEEQLRQWRTVLGMATAGLEQAQAKQPAL